MLYDLVVILLIIGFSFLFKISITKGYDEQLIFILLALVVMVIYKYLTYRNMMRTASTYTTTPNTNHTTIGAVNEPYQDFTDEINDFLGQEVPNGINNGNINEYKSQLVSLQDKVDIMNEYLKDLNTRATTTDENKAAIGGVDFQAGQQIQDYRIKKIQQDIQRTADLIKQNRLAEDAKKYNKIKVFSSCVVAGADGSYSRDMPSTGAGQSMGTDTGMQGGVTGTGLSVAGTIGGGIPGSGNGATGLPSQAPTGSTLGAGSGVDINAVLQSIANNGVDIKLS